MIRNIFLDLDGTLIDCPKGRCGLSDAAAGVLNGLKSRGIKLFVATGRSISLLPPSVRGFGFQGYVLTNGASVWADGRELCRHAFPAGLAARLTKQLEEAGFEYALQIPGGTFLSENRRELLPYFKKHMFDETFLTKKPLADCLPEVLKVEVYVRPGQRERAAQILSPLAYDCPPDGRTVEACPAQVSKASGAGELLSHLGLSMQETMCFGDAENDLELFRDAGWSVAMGNASERVKARACDVCKSVEDEGVARYLEKYFEKLLTS